MFNYFQQISRNWLTPKHQKTGDFGKAPESALGAGGRAFKSPRESDPLEVTADFFHLAASLNCRRMEPL